MNQSIDFQKHCIVLKTKNTLNYFHFDASISEIKARIQTSKMYNLPIKCSFISHKNDLK